MNYITEINSFHDLIQLNSLSTGQIALWYALMHINNICNWKEWFTVSNQVLSVHSGLSRSGIQKARNELKQIGAIDFRDRGTKATAYKIITMSNSVQVSSQDGSQNSNQVSSQDGSQNSNALVKQKETKQDDIKKNIKKEKPKKHRHGEYEHVLLTDEELKHLRKDFGDIIADKAIVHLDEAIEMKGYKYKSCNLAIRKWVIDAVKKKEGVNAGYNDRIIKSDENGLVQRLSAKGIGEGEFEGF